MSLIAYLSLVLFAFLLTRTDCRLERSRTLVLGFVALVMIALAFRLEGMDRGLYLALWDGHDSRVEASFTALADFVNAFTDNPIWLVALYAVIGVSLKMVVIASMGELAFYALLVYVSHYFLLHEMIQIRAGVASGCLLAALVASAARGWLRIPAIGLLAAVGAYFHSSGAVIGLLLFLHPRRLDRGLWLAFLVLGFVALLCGITASSIIEHIDVPAVQDRLVKYLDAMGDGLESNLNRYSPVHCLRAVFAGVCVWYWDRFAQQSRGGVVAIKAYVVSIVAFWAFADIPAVAIRFSQLLCVSEILIIPACVRVWPGWVGLSLCYGLVAVNLVFYSVRLFFAWTGVT